MEPWKGWPPSSVPYQSDTTTVAMPFFTTISSGEPKIGERPSSFG